MLRILFVKYVHILNPEEHSIDTISWRILDMPGELSNPKATHLEVSIDGRDGGGLERKDIWHQ
jgi:hypothetical protein